MFWVQILSRLNIWRYILKNIKAHQRDQLIMEFGILIQPFDDLARSKKAPNLESYRIAIAKVQVGDRMWRQKAKEFATFAQDIIFNDAFSDISHVPERFCRLINELISNPNMAFVLDAVFERFTEELANAKHQFLESVKKVPFEWEPILFEANTPFTSYLRIKESIALVNNRLHYFDRYLKEYFFHLFLKFLGSNISVCLVTTSGDRNYGINNVLHISDLARQQFKNYQLIEVEPEILHDRNLRIDDQIFTLGPGLDRAGMALTNFSPSDSSAAAHRELDKIIEQGNIIHHS